MEISMKPFSINVEGLNDMGGVRTVNIAAFGRQGEADVVDELRDSCSTFISLVAKIEDEIIGHVLFTPVRLIQDQDWSIEGMGLAPLAVLPEYQNQGVGTELCKEGLRKVKSNGYPFAVVLGDPFFYHRFDFVRASDHGIRSSFDGVPDDAFMIKIFNPKVMAGAQGVVYYHQAFDSVS
jgi:putative acetyltransferase